MTPRLKALLRECKALNTTLDLNTVRLALNDIYVENMEMRWALHHVLEAIEEVRAEPWFEFSKSFNTEALLKSLSMRVLYERLDPEHLSLSWVYESLLSEMLSQLQLTRIDWCRDQIWPNPVVSQPTA